MARDNFKDLLALIAIVREGSFTRAAATLGVSQSALSHTIRGLEATLGLRLLTRTTRSVAPTEAGERLIQTVAPRFTEIEDALSALSEMRDTPAGNVRITATDYAARAILWPKLSKLLQQYPDINVEMFIDNGLTDIVADRYDLGVRLGDQVEKDMIAARIAPDMRMALVASPSYLARRPLPKTPQDLTAHRCINLRMKTAGGIYAWELEKDGREVIVRVQGQLTFNGTYEAVDAAVDGFGIAFVQEDLARAHIKAGRLRWIMKDWSPTWPGLHAFYPSRRHSSPAFNLVLDALRYKG
ncbi:MULTISPECIES: LysR family transcriptional regulator [Xanthomonas]|uniref:LysR family transcriptional regulator n=1 Tax=Xanthomonas TaxID=338 RepID=UPI000E1F79B4|nr:MULTISPECIES: LysR family transcriptional regulator [Xanthomonas]MEA9579435.1 LysR family transcriptional regulator [Xanthomonas nasturtii]MEA9588358.1 LysR family transcriptional regulator [Xanthomonas sp. WHRI 10064B]MEA9613344.1 LysR family transcriptional regulator [Xanthomonas sp. WHRI 10064A]